MKNKVYLLKHFYYYGKMEEHTEFKMLGLYSSKEKVNLAIERFYKLEGFNDYPKECFVTEAFYVGKNEEWTEGFIDEPSDWKEE